MSRRSCALLIELGHRVLPTVRRIGFGLSWLSTVKARGSCPLSSSRAYEPVATNRSLRLARGAGIALHSVGYSRVSPNPSTSKSCSATPACACARRSANTGASMASSSQLKGAEMHPKAATRLQVQMRANRFLWVATVPACEPSWFVSTDWQEREVNARGICARSQRSAGSSRNHLRSSPRPPCTSMNYPPQRQWLRSWSARDEKCWPGT